MKYKIILTFEAISLQEEFIFKVARKGYKIMFMFPHAKFCFSSTVQIKSYIVLHICCIFSREFCFEIA